MEKPPPAPPLASGAYGCRLSHSRSLPRRLHHRSKSAGSSTLKPFEFQPLAAPLPNEMGREDEGEEPEARLREHLQHEIRMHDGSTKLLRVASHPEVILESSKNLLVSERRMNCFRKELRRRKSGESLKALWGSPLPSSGKEEAEEETKSASLRPISFDVHNQLPCRALLSVGEIRIPLMWPEKEHFKNRGFLRRFAVFCLVRVGAQIRDTVLVACVDRTSTDVTFQDVLIFKRVPPDFECVLEIYAHNLDDEIVSTPSLIRRKLGHVTASVGRTMGRRMANGVREEGPETPGGPEFALVARATLTLDDVDDYGRSHDLEIITTARDRDARDNKLPLFGQICCRMAARPLLKIKSVVEGELRLGDAAGADGGSWTPFFCRLCDRRVSCWSSREEAESGRPSYMQIPVSAYRTQLGLASATDGDDDDENSHFRRAIILRDGDDVDAHRFFLSAETTASRDEWWAAFHQHLLDQSSWGRRICESSTELDGFDFSFISSSDFNDCFDSPNGGSPFGTLTRTKAGKSSKKEDFRKSPQLARSNLYESVTLELPGRPTTSSSNLSSSSSGRVSPRHRRTPSTSSSCSSRSTPTTPKASFSAFPSLDEEELDKLFLKYTSSPGSDDSRGSSSGSNNFSAASSSPSKRFNSLFPSMTLKPRTKKLPL